MQQQTPNQPVCIEEDEIDLVELLRTIKRRRKVIYIVTGLITLGAVIYAFLKTPLYEVKANMRVGFIGKNLLVDPATLAKTLQSVYHIDEPSFKAKEFNSSGAYVESIDYNPRKVKNFITIKIVGLDNEKAIAKAQEVVAYAQREYQPKIDQYILNTKNEIEGLLTKKRNILKVVIPNLQTEIELIKKQKIPMIENKIKFYKEFKIKEIEEKKRLYEEKLKEYNRAIQKLYEQFGKADDTKVMIASIQMVNYQNLILGLENKLRDLEQQKIKINMEIVPQLLNEAERIKLVQIKSVKDKILEQKNKITDIENKIKVLQYNISEANIQNSKVVGGFVANDHPAKPKRKLIVVVAFVTGLILSIFLIFLIEFWEENKKRLEE